MTEDNSGLFGDSRRSFMKKGALAASAVALGSGVTAGVGAAQDGGDGEVVLFGDDYHPGVEFTVASDLDDGTRDDLFSEAGLEEEFDSPDDWTVYIINYDMGGSAPSLGFLMTENVDLSAGDSETMGADGSFRNAELNLVEATPGETGGAGGGGGGNGGDENATEEDDGAGGGGGGGNGDGGGA